MEAQEIKKKVKDKAKDFDTLFSRMDKDFDMWNLAETTDDTSIRAKTKRHQTDIDIISNEPRTFSDNVQSTLASAEVQIMIRMAEEEGEDKRSEIAKLERLLYFALEKADERLRRAYLPPFPPMREQIIWYSLVRGWVAARILAYKEDKGVVFDFMPWDPRYVVYGNKWIAYETFRTKEDLKKEWDFETKKEKDNSVIDYWEDKGKGKITNAVICEDGFLKTPETLDIPSMPILIMPVSTRPPVAGDTMEGYGESIFAPIRNINAIRNRFASMVATHANLMANQALINYKDDLGVSLESTANIPGGVLELSMGHNRLEPSPMKEISPTVTAILGWLNDQMERGTLPQIPIGVPAPSGTMYNLAQEAGKKIFNPQLRNLSYFYADICRLIEEQLIAGGIKVKIQGEDKKKKYYETQVTPVDLKKPHIIKVEFTAQTPWSQLDTYQVADMAKRLGVPEGYIWEYILKFPDPKGMADLAAIELFEHSPKGAMKRAVEALMEQRGDVVGAQSLAEDLDKLEAMEAGQQAEEPPTGGPESPLSLEEEI